MTEHHKTSSQEKAGLALLLMAQGLQYLNASAALGRSSRQLNLELPPPPTAELLRKATGTTQPNPATRRP